VTCEESHSSLSDTPFEPHCQKKDLVRIAIHSIFYPSNKKKINKPKVLDEASHSSGGIN
jgi:hypothetical protein